MEQLVENRPREIASVFARAFELAMQIERWRFLGAGDCERMPEIHGYANSCMPKRIETSARKLSMQVPQTAGHDGVRFLDLPNALRFFRG